MSKIVLAALLAGSAGLAFVASSSSSTTDQEPSTVVVVNGRAPVAGAASGNPTPRKAAEPYDDLSTNAAAANGFIRHDIAPSTVDPKAVQVRNSRTGVPNNHLVLVPTDRTTRVRRLFLFIGGTTSSELITQEIMRDGVGRGYHSIAIAYPNEQAVGTLCLGSTDDGCSAKVRGEILTGADLTPLVTVAPADALEPRLRKLLVFLKANYPNEGWDNFLVNGDVDWSKVSTVGHSQGAGHAAFLAKFHDMFRAVMISGVADITAAGQPAPWLRQPNKTSVERQYGFTHLADYVVTVAIANASWDAIGLSGLLTMTDGKMGSGYGNSHRLTTALKPKSGANPHVSMLEDASMPRAADGSPAFKPVWEYMAFPR